MSQRPPASRPASRSPTDGQRIILPPVQLRDDTQDAGRSSERQQPEPGGRGFPPQLPPPTQPSRIFHAGPTEEDWRPSGPSRDLGVHSILNPTEPEGARGSPRYSSLADFPPRAIDGSARFGASPSASTSHTFPSQQLPQGAPPAAEGYGATFSRAPRRILTPRSPSRAVSLGRGGPPATFDAQRSPYIPARGRPYAADPGPSPSSEIPPMPTPPGQTKNNSGFPSAASTPIIAPRRDSGSTMQAPGRTPLSQSASPSISASSHNPSSNQTSPASFLYQQGGQTPQTTTSYFPGSSFSGTPVQQGGGMQFQGPPGGGEGPYSAQAPQTQGSSLHSSSAGSSRQTSATDPYQVLTINTSEGSYHVPVDVHQASRLADEKRARNAGASARFRQRRKEKEKEASTAIDKLQQQTRDLERRVRETEQERDFYRTERDRFRDAVFRNPDMRHLATQAPQSPQSMRTGTFQGSMLQMGGPPPPAMGFQPPESSPPGRAPRRRRTDTRDFSNMSYSLPPSSTLPPAPPSGYTPVGPSQGQAPTNLPSLRTDTAARVQPPSNPPSTTSGPQPPHDPFSRGSYERGWPSEGGRR